MWILSARGIWWTVTNSGDISGTIAIEMDEGTYIHALDNGLFTLGAPHREESAGRGQDVWTDTSMPVLSEDSGLHETLALLTSQLRPDSSHKEEMGFLRDVFSEKSLSYLMKIHEKLHYYERQSPTPVLHSAMALTEDQAVLMVHDTVAQKNFDPVLPCLPDNIDEDFDEESVKIVRPLGEEQGTLGATIRRDEHSGAVVVARIIRGGAADRSGLVHVGDELREVNGIAVLHKRPDEISQIVAQSQGSITLKMIPATQEEDCLKESKMIGLVTKRPVTVRATSKGTMWDEQQQEMAASAAFIGQHYGHLVDTVLVREDLQGAYSQLIVVLEKLGKDTRWGPVSWVR
ncbi:MAGUK p55 subfamily member 3 isoform X5 [Callithrix jacchus]